MTIRDCVAWGMHFPAICLLALGVPAIAQQHTITTIDAPHAGTTSGYGTAAIAICPAGQVTGIYSDPSNIVHAFVLLNIRFFSWRDDFSCCRSQSI